MRRALIAAGLVLAGVCAAGLSVHWTLNRPLGGEATTTLGVARGSTLRPVLRRLAADGVLGAPRLLYVYARLIGATAIQSGDYEISADQSPVEILRALVDGRVKLDTVTLAEGLNRWQVRQKLAAERWVTAETFDTLCGDAGFLKRHGIPGPTCDGYLYPDTYTLARGVPAEKVFATLFAAYKEQLAAATARGLGPMSLSERELVTLASVVEKETGAPEERPRIACVFYNRLQARPRWRLQTDPTVIYAATLADPGFNGNLRREHLRQLVHPYNTYLRDGLPPGPIASPGRAALDAVVEPAKCDDYFFVSMNNGRHVFCSTLDCHNRAVQRWQVDFFKGRETRSETAAGVTAEAARRRPSGPGPPPRPRSARERYPGSGQTPPAAARRRARQ